MKPREALILPPVMIPWCSVVFRQHNDMHGRCTVFTTILPFKVQACQGPR